MTLTYAAVEDRVLAGDNGGVRDLLHGVAEAERRACAADVKDLARTVFAEPGWSNGRWRAATAAVVGCTGGAAAVAKVLLRRGADDVSMDVLLDRAPDWLPDLLARLAAADDPWGQHWPATERLRVALGAPYPRTDAYLRGLVAHVGAQDVPVLDRLRADSDLLALVPRILQVPDVHLMMSRCAVDVVHTDGAVQHVERSAERTWEGAIATLTLTGGLDRDRVLDTVLALLLAGGKREHLAWALALHDRLGPAGEEVAGRARSYLRLLADGPGPAATAAQRALRDVDGAGRLEVDALLEASRAVLHRREKGLVAAQLRWLERVARRCPDRAADVAEAVCAAFGHERLELQEKSLEMVTSLVPGLEPETLARLRTAAEDLSPLVRARAGVLLPPDTTALPSEPIGGPGPVRPAPAAVRDAAELAEVVAAAYESPDPMLFELVVDGVARLANADRAAFERALAPLQERIFGQFVDRPWFWLSHTLLVNVLRCRPRRRTLLSRFAAPPYTGRLPSPEGPHALTVRRLGEVVAQVYDGQRRALLALPTAGSGHIDGVTLVRRCAELEEHGEQPWPVDLEQALLRLPRETDAALLSAASQLRSPAGGAVHARLLQGPPPDPVCTVVTDRARHPHPRWGGSGDTERDLTLAALPPGGWPADLGLGLARPHEVAGMAYWGEQVADCRALLLMLPSHREVTAAFALAHVTAARTRLPDAPRETLAALPEAEGPAGAAVHLLVGYAACAPDAVGRTVAADALLALAEQGALDGERLARALAHLAETGDALPGRLAQTFGEVARASSAGATLVHATLSALAPPLLERRARDTHTLLAVAAEAALASGARGTVHGLDAVADSRGSSRLVVEARRWRDLLTRP